MPKLIEQLLFCVLPTYWRFAYLFVYLKYYKSLYFIYNCNFNLHLSTYWAPHSNVYLQFVYCLKEEMYWHLEISVTFYFSLCFKDNFKNSWWFAMWVSCGKKTSYGSKERKWKNLLRKFNRAIESHKISKHNEPHSFPTQMNGSRSGWQM